MFSLVALMLAIPDSAFTERVLLQPISLLEQPVKGRRSGRIGVDVTEQAVGGRVGLEQRCQILRHLDVGRTLHEIRGTGNALAIKRYRSPAHADTLNHAPRWDATDIRLRNKRGHVGSGQGKLPTDEQMPRPINRQHIDKRAISCERTTANP